MEKTTINDLRKGDRIAVRDHNGKQVPMFIENIRSGYLPRPNGSDASLF